MLNTSYLAIFNSRLKGAPLGFYAILRVLPYFDFDTSF
jgi:hypothetical protein